MHVITGGGTGIGQALALHLAKSQQKVLIIGRRISLLQAVAQHSDLIQYCAADVSSSSGREMILQRLKNEKIQALIHNAGTIEPIEKIKNVVPEDWEKIFHINVFAPFRLTQLLLPQLQGARVLHIGSGAAYFPITGWSGYCASKAALSMLTRCYQVEMQDPVFSSVMPGIVDTAMTAEIRQSLGSMDAEQHAFHQALYEQGRILQSSTVALFLAWLLLTVDKTLFASKEWDIYDTSHHPHWLVPPHQVPGLG